MGLFKSILSIDDIGPWARTEWRRNFLAGLLGVVIAAGVGVVVVAPFTTAIPPERPPLWLTTIPAGLAFGIVHYRIMRGVGRRLLSWVPLSAAGAIVGGALGLRLLGVLMSNTPMDWPKTHLQAFANTWLLLLYIGFSGFIAGLVLGAFQWVAVRRRLWIAETALAWGLLWSVLLGSWMAPLSFLMGAAVSVEGW